MAWQHSGSGNITLASCKEEDEEYEELEAVVNLVTADSVIGVIMVVVIHGILKLIRRYLQHGAVQGPRFQVLL